MGLSDGRYLVRAGDEPERVLVIRVVGAQRAGRFRRRPRRVAPGPEAEALPVTIATAITAASLGTDGQAAAWLQATARQPDEWVTAGLALLNRTIYTQRAAAIDPYLHEVARRDAVAIRLGYGTGDDVAEGRWRDAVELPVGERRKRIDEVSPQERVAAVLGGRGEVGAAETLILRARLDLDQGRTREAALQARVGVEALLAELSGKGPVGEAEDRGALEGLRSSVADAANAAVRGALSAGDDAAVTEAVTVAERILRRRALRT